MPRCLFLLCLILAGCQSVVGPVRRAQQPPPRIDNPCLPIDEQERRGRANLGYPDTSKTAGPNVG